VTGTPPPDPDCWLHPDVEVRDSPIAGKGLFAQTLIPEGTRVSRLGGTLISEAELRRLIEDPSHPYVDSITVSPTEHLLLPPRRPNGYGNHGCDPNLWWTGPYDLTTRRAIEADEELTNDYAMSTADESFTMPCACRSELCRGVITGADWRDPGLQARYGSHWIPALLSRIAQAPPG
jgi:hypothetical protein